MQYVSGKTLREFIGRLKLKEAVGYAMQIADGLAGAHAHGIVHRDLKPENAIVRDNGAVTILDFGLAKLTEREGPEEAQTLGKEERLTREGHVVGTAAYMSPEQAEGKTVDARSDIFSFGSVLYEMVTGQCSFPGKNVSSILAAILRDEPKPSGELVPSMPSELERLIWRALRKERERRWQSMADVRVTLSEVKEELDSVVRMSGVRVPAAVPPRRRWPLWVGGAVITALVVAVGLWVYVTREAPGPPPKTTPLTSYPGGEWEPALSPDGSLVAFTRIGEAGTRDLNVKQIDGGEPLTTSPGLGDAWSPAWSPDGQRIAFLRTVDADEDAPADGIFTMPTLGGPARRYGVFRSRSGLS